MIHFYHPNRGVKGSACSFWRSDKHGDLFATLIKQSGWDDTTKRGTFKASLDDPNKRITIKLSEIEAGAILDCIERNRPFTNYHSFDEFPKSISFVPWMITPAKDADGNQPPPVQEGFSFSVTVGNKSDASAKNHFYIGLKYAEARYLREFLIHYLHTTFRRSPAAASVAPAIDDAVPANNPDADSSN